MSLRSQRLSFLALLSGSQRMAFFPLLPQKFKKIVFDDIYPVGSIGQGILLGTDKTVLRSGLKEHGSRIISIPIGETGNLAVAL